MSADQLTSSVPAAPISSGPTPVPLAPSNKSLMALPRYSLGEEIANAVTHGIGVLLSVAGLTMLIVLSALFGNGWHLASAIVYGIALVLLYSASTLYHSIQIPSVKKVLRVIDHSSIYLLIGGTYTPFTLVTLSDAGGIVLFGIVWGIAVFGIIIEAFWIHRPKWITILGYLAMGWLVMLKINPLIDNLQTAGLWLLIAGGITYTVGTIFYLLKRIPYMHSIW
ncbi:MAG: hemolysin III family protein, partial [Myxococcales bacterium]|nr:hemolysin III family protein [Myxococcales bacterium]